MDARNPTGPVRLCNVHIEVILEDRTVNLQYDREKDRNLKGSGGLNAPARLLRVNLLPDDCRLAAPAQPGIMRAESEVAGLPLSVLLGETCVPLSQFPKHPADLLFEAAEAAEREGFSYALRLTEITFEKFYYGDGEKELHFGG